MYTLLEFWGIKLMLDTLIFSITGKKFPQYQLTWLTPNCCLVTWYINAAKAACTIGAGHQSVTVCEFTNIFAKFFMR